MVQFNTGTSPFANKRNETGSFDASHLRKVISSPLQQRHMQERMREQERELRIREEEGIRIQRFNEQIERVREQKENGLISEESMNLSIKSITSRIGQIQINRSNSEQAAIERESIRQQAEMDEQIRKQEERMREQAEAAEDDVTDCEWELEQKNQRNMTRSLTSISTSIDNIRSLSSTRASMAAEAGQMSNSADASTRRQEQWESIVEGKAIANPSVMNTPKERYNLLDGWNGRHLENLNTGIARISAKIESEIASIYRESQAMQEANLRYARDAAGLENRNEDEEDNEKIDIKL